MQLRWMSYDSYGVVVGDDVSEVLDHDVIQNAIDESPFGDFELKSRTETEWIYVNRNVVDFVQTVKIVHELIVVVGLAPSL